jgi:hypothetical protein
LHLVGFALCIIFEINFKKFLRTSSNFIKNEIYCLNVVPKCLIFELFSDDL